MKSPMFRVKPRFSDFNLQGLLKGSLHFDFVCEAHLDALATRYGIEFSKYARSGLRWNISSYSIAFHEENKSLAAFLVETHIVRIQDCDKAVSFAFWSEDGMTKYASGEILFSLYDTAKKVHVPIPADDVKSLSVGSKSEAESI